MDQPSKGLGAKPKRPGRKLPKLPPLRNNVVTPDVTDDISDKPLYSQHDIDDTTDNKPFLNRRTDSEILIIQASKHSLEDLDDEDEQQSEDEKKTKAKQEDTKDETDLEKGLWLKPVHGRVRKGFDTKEKRSQIPTKASRDRTAFPPQDGIDDDTDTTFIQNRSFVKRQLWTMFSPTDNRLSMKLFGSRKGIQKEKQRLKAAGHFIIHPCSKFRFYWDLIMLILILWNILALPVVITFFKHDDLSHSWTVFTAIMDTLFQLDVIFNFRTGFMDNHSSERVILAPRRIARHYLKTWFFVDFISAIPMDYIFMIFDTSGPNTTIWEVSRALKFLRFAKLLSLIRLLRLSRLMRFVGQYEQIFNVASAVIRISNLVMMMLLIGHWNGCLQFLVPVIQDFPPYSWVSINRLQNASFWEQYTWSLFKAMSHMLCIGYGRFPPQCTTDVWLTMVSMISGATCFALFIGHATNLIQSMDSSSRQYREKLKQVEEYMSYHKLPKAMRLKVLDYYEYRYHGKMFDEKQIFSEVSQNILEDVANYNCRELVASVPFFTDADPAFVTRVVSLLNFELFQPGDYILRVGTFGDRMFFIQSGIVDIITPEGYVQTTLSDGSYFGEICLMTKLRRTASVKACSYCCLYSLSVESFFRVLNEYPAMHKTMREVAKVRLGRLGKDSQIKFLDTGVNAADQENTQGLFKVPPPASSTSSGSAVDDECWPRYGPHKPFRNLEQIAREQAALQKESERLIKIINIQDEQGRKKSEHKHEYS